MKAILVIDLNDTTLKEWDTDTSKCWAEIKVHTPIKGGTHGIGCVYADNNVEIKPMPASLDWKFINETTNEDSFEYGRCIGRQELIDEIQGE